MKPKSLDPDKSTAHIEKLVKHIFFFVFFDFVNEIFFSGKHRKRQEKILFEKFTVLK